MTGVIGVREALLLDRGSSGDHCPHLLVCASAGQGKSAFVRCVLFLCRFCFPSLIPEAHAALCGREHHANVPAALFGRDLRSLKFRLEEARMVG